MDETVEDGIGEGGVAEPVVPFLDRELAGDQRGPGGVSVLEEFEQVAAMVGIELGEPERSFRLAATRRSGRRALVSRAAVVEAEALTVHFQDMDVMGQSVEQRPGQALGTERPRSTRRREDSR